MTMIEAYADVWCPFAHVGLRAVFQQRNELKRDDVVIRVRAWPLELVNAAPLDVASTAEHVSHLRTQVAPDLFSHFDPTHFPRTSLPALALAAAAYRQSDKQGEAVSLALRNALFEEGRDISQPAVLETVASTCDVDGPDAEDSEAVRADWHQGASRGVKGSPHFFCGEVEAFCPSLDISKDEEGHLHIRQNVETLAWFLTECFKQLPGSVG